MRLPPIQLRTSQKTAGGHGVLHSTEEWGINGVKNKAMENALNKARLRVGLRRLDCHQVAATNAVPRMVQTQGVRIVSIMDDVA